MFAIQGHRLPSVCSYEDAARLWERLEGNQMSCGARGLVSKREWDKRMRKVDDHYQFWFHHTLMVSWDSPTQFHVDHHDSASSRIFVNRFLPNGVQAYSFRDVTVINDVRGDFTRWNFLGKQWVVDLNTARNFTQVKSDRVAVGEIRKRFKAYRKWAQGVAALKGGQPTSSNWYDHQGIARELLIQYPGEIPMEAFPKFGEVTPEVLVNAAIVVSGAVWRENLPIGELPKRTAWDGII